MLYSHRYQKPSGTGVHAQVDLRGNAREGVGYLCRAGISSVCSVVEPDRGVRTFQGAIGQGVFQTEPGIDLIIDVAS